LGRCWNLGVLGREYLVFRLGVYDDGGFVHRRSTCCRFVVSLLLIPRTEDQQNERSNDPKTSRLCDCATPSPLQIPVDSLFSSGDRSLRSFTCRSGFVLAAFFAPYVAPFDPFKAGILTS